MSPRSTSAEFRPALLIQGGIAVTVDSERRVEPLDLRLRDGRIVEIGRNLRPAGEALLDATGCAVLPGLVHAHVHLCQVLFRNQAEDRALLPWLRERIWPFEAAHTPSSLRASAELGIAELLLAGATCVLDMGTVHHHDAVFEAARELGIRLCSGKAMMDAGAGVPDGLRETTEDSLRESDRLAEKWNGAEDDRLRYAFAPRLALSCSPALLRAVASRLAGGARLHTHASENVEEIELVRARFGQDNVEMLGTFGLLTPRTTLAHGVHLSSREIELLAETGTSVAHCPSSNLKLASGIADVLSLLAAGVNVGLGADGAPCNNNLDLWREMKLAGLLPRLKYGPRTLTPMKILELATLGGARAMGWDDQIGSLEEGKRADIILVDLLRPHLQPVGSEVATALVYAAQAADVRTVLVDGRVVVRDRELVTGDTGRIIASAVGEAALLAKRAGPTTAQ